jgi:hypothetical protein
MINVPSASTTVAARIGLSNLSGTLTVITLLSKMAGSETASTDARTEVCQAQPSLLEPGDPRQRSRVSLMHL